jgi:FAD/FMN-containing dehydrogenase
LPADGRDRSAPEGLTLDPKLDRRAFLAAVGGAVLVGGCGASGHADPAPAARAARRRPLPRTGPRTLQQAVRGHVFTPGTPGYAGAAHVYNTRFDGIRPAAVARAHDGLDVRDALRFTIGRGLRVRARSGGHSYAGYSTIAGGIVLDLRLLKGITVDRRAGTATVGAGAQLIDIAAALAAHGATLPSGSCPSVGISGVTLGGGFGLAARSLGLTTDNLRGVEIVTPDAELRTVDARHDPELLWALRGGGGGNFGVVTAFTFRIHRLPASAAYFDVVWPWTSAAEAINAWQSWAPHTTDAISSILHLNSGSPTRPPSISAGGQYLGPSSALPALLRPLLAVPGAQLAGLGQMAYLPLQLRWAGCEGDTLAACHTVGTAAGATLPRNTFNAKSDYVSRPFSGAGLSALVSAVESQAGSGSILCDSYGGEVNRTAPTDTAFVHRRELFCMQYYGDGAGSAWIEQAWRKLQPYVSGQAYQNYIDPALDGWQQAYYGENYPRLREIRRQVDPHHYFKFPQAIA